MFGEIEGEYLPLTNRCGYYKPNSVEQLRTKKLKQPWRNHLLGIKLVEVGELDQFYSVHLYPKGNTYQTKVCNEYLECLKDDFKNTFEPLTFNKFISAAEEVLKENEYIKKTDWINYLKNRY